MDITFATGYRALKFMRRQRLRTTFDLRRRAINKKKNKKKLKEKKKREGSEAIKKKPVNGNDQRAAA